MMTDAAELEESVRLKAYSFWEASGRTHGHDQADWLWAESIVTPQASVEPEAMFEPMGLVQPMGFVEPEALVEPAGMAQPAGLQPDPDGMPDATSDPTFIDAIKGEIHELAETASKAVHYVEELLGIVPADKPTK